VESGGRLGGGPIPDELEHISGSTIRENADSGSVVSYDGRCAHRDLRDRYVHGYVDHGAGECVRSEHRTNSIEGPWSVLGAAAGRPF